MMETRLQASMIFSASCYMRWRMDWDSPVISWYLKTRAGRHIPYRVYLTISSGPRTRGTGKETGCWIPLLFPVPSAALADQLQSPPIYFKGPVTKQVGGENPKMYVPTEFNRGSSIYHLDEIYNTIGWQHKCHDDLFLSARRGDP